MKTITLIILLFTVNISFSQNTIKVRKDSAIYTVVDKMPQFPGGEQKLYEFLGKQTKYPDSLKESMLSGTVYIQFIIEKDGSVTNPIIIRSPHFLFSQEVMRVIKRMPKWIPAEQEGEKVRFRFNLPVKFWIR